MGVVIPFPLAPSFTCRTVTQAEADTAQEIMAGTMGACPACTGRGWIFHRDYTASPCPCGGTDEDRIEIPDFEGAARMIPSALVPYGFPIAGLLGLAIGICIANRIERRRMARERAEAIREELPPLPEPKQIGTFTNLSVPVNAVVSRLREPPAAAVLRRETAAKSFPKAAE